MRKIAGMLNFFLGAVFTLIIVSVVSFKNTPGNISEPGNHWIVPSIPSELSFAGEQAPITRFDIKEKFDKEYLNNYYNQGNILYLIKLAHRNFPIISDRLKVNGVPDDFKYLCIAESNMQSWAISSSGAVGFWQFLKGTAPGYGLESNDLVDERRNLVKSTDAACRYFKDAYALYGNWTAAAASYNCGMGGYSSQVKFQHTSNYYDLNLPEETNKYIFRILSFKYLMENADKLGFELKDEEKYQAVPTRSIIVNSDIPDLASFAISNGTSYKMLRVLNPWIIGRSLRGGHNYTLLLPGDSAKASDKNN
jgi:membrane-bound lytic murein transglycosylase D